MPTPRRRAPGPLGAAGLLATALLLTGCAATAASSAPTWTPKPSFSGEGYAPVPGTGTAPPSSSAPGLPGGALPSGSAGTADSAVVATHLREPTGIAILPDNTALVGERTTGRIVRVQPRPGQPVRTVRTLTGLSTAGGGGLLDLAVSPNYAEDNLIFAYITTPSDNRVVDFTLTGPVTTVLSGIPHGRSDNTGRIAFAADGSLLVGTGDAGRPALAANPASLAGKILRISDIGRPAAGNPRPASPVYASGLRRTDGLCTAAHSTLAVQVEDLPGRTADAAHRVTAGASYGWPRPRSASTGPLVTLPAPDSTPGGCALQAGRLFVTSLDGKALLAADLRTTANGGIGLGRFTTMLHNRYGRLRTVVAAADGALWLSTDNRDGNGRPVPDDERVLRIVPTGGSSGSSKE